ncbi:MAG: hypothetical protein PVJ84_05855 [Desulfobacteraceae bacterium]
MPRARNDRPFRAHVKCRQNRRRAHIRCNKAGNNSIGPLLCPKCQGAIKVISFIEDDALIKKILAHLGLWDTRKHDPPQSNEVHIPTFETELTNDYTYWQLPPIDYWTP